MARVGAAGMRSILGRRKVVTGGIYRTNHSRGVSASASEPAGRVGLREENTGEAEGEGHRGGDRMER
jgi:hypothetical protein